MLIANVLRNMNTNNGSLVLTMKEEVTVILRSWGKEPDYLKLSSR